MNSLYIIKSGIISPQLEKMIRNTREVTNSIIVIEKPDYIPSLQNKRILFAIGLNEIGANSQIFEYLNVLYSRGKDPLLGSVAGLFVHSPNEFYTKSITKNVIFVTNQLGCSFIGHPLVEATGDLRNFLTWKKHYNTSLEKICQLHCINLIKRLLEYEPPSITNPKIAVFHSSSRKTSNTLLLWDMIKTHIKNIDIEELHVENGTVLDCKGCAYKTCMHYSQQSSCFYGGFMVKEIFPAIEKACAIIWICPNYNDSISANLMAVINRLTSLYRKTRLYDKTFFSIIVSGNSGSDSVAKQLIDALNVNKGLYLPPYFSIMATANDTGSVLKIENIEITAKNFANNINNMLKMHHS